MLPFLSVLLSGILGGIGSILNSELLSHGSEYFTQFLQFLLHFEHLHHWFLFEVFDTLFWLSLWFFDELYYVFPGD